MQYLLVFTWLPTISDCPQFFIYILDSHTQTPTWGSLSLPWSSFTVCFSHELPSARLMSSREHLFFCLSSIFLHLIFTLGSTFVYIFPFTWRFHQQNYDHVDDYLKQNIYLYHMAQMIGSSPNLANSWHILPLGMYK